MAQTSRKHPIRCIPDSSVFKDIYENECTNKQRNSKILEESKTVKLDCLESWPSNAAEWHRQAEKPISCIPHNSILEDIYKNECTIKQRNSKTLGESKTVKLNCLESWRSNAAEWHRQVKNAPGLAFQTVQYLFQAKKLQDSSQP